MKYLRDAGDACLHRCAKYRLYFGELREHPGSTRRFGNACRQSDLAERVATAIGINSDCDAAVCWGGEIVTTRSLSSPEQRGEVTIQAKGQLFNRNGLREACGPPDRGRGPQAVGRHCGPSVNADESSR